MDLRGFVAILLAVLVAVPGTARAQFAVPGVIEAEDLTESNGVFSIIGNGSGGFASTRRTRTSSTLVPWGTPTAHSRRGVSIAPRTEA